MWYAFLPLLIIVPIFLFSKAKIKYSFEGVGRLEIHFVFFALHLTPSKNKRRRMRISPAAILKSARELLSKSTVVINRLSIPVNSSPTVPDARFLGINISYPLIYAYLTANSEKLIVSENAVIKERTPDFKFLVSISLQTTAVNLINNALSLLFSKHPKREA